MMQETGKQSRPKVRRLILKITLTNIKKTGGWSKMVREHKGNVSVSAEGQWLITGQAANE